MKRRTSCHTPSHHYDVPEAKEAIVEALKKNKQKYEEIEIQYHAERGFVYSLTREKSGKDPEISLNGYHVGVFYNGNVYCNIHPYGLPISAWLNNFIGVGYCVVTPSKYQV